MSREVDVREQLGTAVTPERTSSLRAAADELTRELPGDQAVRIEEFDAATGNPAVVASQDAPAEDGDFVKRALDHVQELGGVLGFAADQPTEVVPDAVVQETSSGAHAVNLHQQHRGIPIYDAARTVRFAPGGEVTEVVGRTVTVDADGQVTPKLTVEEAVRRAAEYVARPDPDEEGTVDAFGEPVTPPAVDLDGFEPKVTAAFQDKPDMPAVLEPGPFGDVIRANLIWFPADQLRLGWEVLLTLGNYDAQYRTIVDAETGEILLCKQLVATVLGRGNVYRVDGGASRQMTDFPVALSELGLPDGNGGLPQGFPDDWVEAGSAAGNSVFAHLGDSGPTIQGQQSGGRIVFDPADAKGDDQKVLNIFYFNCVMHDYFYLLGFREGDGNFQRQNFGRGGVASDRVDARSYPGGVSGTASMGTPVDGSSPVMKMGLVTSTNRHTAFDSTVVFHEFMHGVTNRLVGGPMNVRALDAPQSGGMGEGWGDYVACTITGRTVVGSWVVNDPNGIREFRYDSNFPDDFGDLGTGRYNEVHNVGEIWCATLLEMNRRIDAPFAIQLVVDALKLSPANPSFLDMRDAILAALEAQRSAGRVDEATYLAKRAGIWAAFAKFGMGPGARTNGAFLNGIVPDFTVPEGPTSSVIERTVSPQAAIPDNAPGGITSAIEVEQGGAVERVVVSVDIQHSYVGDLVVSLTPPGASRIVLHDRRGGSADDLVRVYDSEGEQVLAPVKGTDARGVWTLQVSDRARLDVGKLRSWGLRLELDAQDPAVRGTSRPALRIPDNDQRGVTDTIAFAQAGNVAALNVALDLTHTFVGDLRVQLTAPSGQAAILHDREGGSQDNLILTLDSGDNGKLAGLLGQGIAGEWKLNVADLAGQDVGKLNTWSLEIEPG
jgi:extracellular elastinolytic metalloproteinase